ncbi:MAG TPA: DUF1549 domain-containing protein, partial [Planctomycetaceae bacterium]|nr:DUF1549 domain-containing protein [Planctomycetaceae bacterium]
MIFSDSKQLELDTLLEAVCEDRLSPEESLRLEKWLGESSVARKRYREYIILHGILHWDTAIGLDSTELPVFRLEQASTSRPKVAVATIPLPRRVARWSLSAVVLAALGLLVVSFVKPGTGQPDLGLSSGNGLASQNIPSESDAELSKRGSETPRPRGPVEIHEPIVINGSTPSTESLDGVKIVEEKTTTLTVGSSDETIRDFVARELSARWAEHQIVPSPYADDLEWMRRVYLDLVGHIPPAYEADRFVSDTNPRKREQLVDDLLDRSEYVQNWSSIWANLMVGRAPERMEYREQLQKFLRDSFRENRPWNEVVAEIVSAEGSLEENGASGFLLAHVNNQAVPATAITAKLFLGTDVQCTQCHDHPTNGEKQNQFWELNSFFKQTARKAEPV